MLKVSKSKMHDGFWSFLEKYGYHYEGDHTRALLPCEVWFLLPSLFTMLLKMASSFTCLDYVAVLCFEFPFFFFFFFCVASFILSRPLYA